jgi:glycosyltransferase involved in cell wall biosynthesis
MHTLSVVIPAYNEEKGIEALLKKATDVCGALPGADPRLRDCEIIVVNDGSEDRTREIIEQFPSVKLVNHPANRGYGAALKTGFAEARGEYIAFLDADSTYPPEALEDLFDTAIATDADMIVGSRMAGNESGMPVQRRIGNMISAWTLSWIANRRITDTASGMRLFKKSILKTLEPLPDGLDFTPSMSTLALAEDLNVVEVPIRYHKRVGASKLNGIRDGLQFLRSILTLAELYNPLKFFGTAGLVALCAAFLLGLGPLGHYLRFHEVPDDRIYRLFMIIILTVSGLNAITFGISLRYVLALIHRRFQKGTRMTRIFRSSILGKLDIVGVCLVAGAVLLNWRTIYQYVTTAHIWEHWSYMYAGAFLFLIGIHLIMIGRLVRIFEMLQERKREKK